MVSKKDIDYFLGIANAISLRSKDPSTKVGCYIVRKDLTPASSGYNGFVKGCNEVLMTFQKPAKLKTTAHAEFNACLFAKDDLTDCKAFVTHAPCSNCLLALFQKNVKEIYFENLGPIARYGSIEISAIISILRSNVCIVKNKDGENLVDILEKIEFNLRNELDLIVHQIESLNIANEDVAKAISLLKKPL